MLEQKFLESGHSMMECDSMHSAIEKQKRFMSVYTMHDWMNIFSAARSNRNKKNAKPYAVKELKYSDFYDLGLLSKQILKNKTRNTAGQKVNWLKVKCFRFEKNSPTIIKYRYGHSGEYLEINISIRNRAPTYPHQLSRVYNTPLPISSLKHKDLMVLCEKGVIPQEFHHWYQSLPSSTSVINRNPEPDAGSDTEEED